MKGSNLRPPFSNITIGPPASRNFHGGKTSEAARVATAPE